jgi:hypothetical protein
MAGWFGMIHTPGTELAFLELVLERRDFVRNLTHIFFLVKLRNMDWKNYGTKNLHELPAGQKVRSRS